jgi:hypothetical protein
LEQEAGYSIKCFSATDPLKMYSERFCAKFKATTAPNLYLGLLADLIAVIDEPMYESWYDWTTWKKVVLTYFIALFHYLPERTAGKNRK